VCQCRDESIATAARLKEGNAVLQVVTTVAGKLQELIPDLAEMVGPVFSGSCAVGVLSCQPLLVQRGI
jgi:hypothetical protein